MYRELKQTYSKLRVIYSGCGFHIHVLDSDAKYLKRAERSALAKRCAKRFPIDEWITAGNIKLIRLPYTLHGMISRICVPIDPNELETFNPINYGPAEPRFLTFERTCKTNKGLLLIVLNATSHFLLLRLYSAPFSCPAYL